MCRNVKLPAMNKLLVARPYHAALVQRHPKRVRLDSAVPFEEGRTCLEDSDTNRCICVVPHVRATVLPLVNRPVLGLLLHIVYDIARMMCIGLWG